MVGFEAEAEEEDDDDDEADKESSSAGGIALIEERSECFREGLGGARMRMFAGSVG